MRAAEVMTDDVQTVPADMPAVEAWDMMRRRGIRHLVAMAGHDVIGVLSERDAGGRSGAGLRTQSSVGDLMTRRVVTVGPTTTVRRIANLMRGRTIGCVPVMDGRRLVGIVTVSDLLDLLGRGGDRPARPERHALHYRAPHGKHRKVRRASGVW